MQYHATKSSRSALLESKTYYLNKSSNITLQNKARLATKTNRKVKAVIII